MTSNPSNSGWPSVLGFWSPAFLWAKRNCSDFVQAMKSSWLSQTVCEAYSTWSSRSGPRSNWKVPKPFTSFSLDSRPNHISSKAFCWSFKTLNRFMAMNIRFSPAVAFLAVSRTNHQETRPTMDPRRARSRFRRENRGDAALALIRRSRHPPIHGIRDVLEGLPPNNAAADLIMENFERGKDTAGTVSL